MSHRGINGFRSNDGNQSTPGLSTTQPQRPSQQPLQQILQQPSEHPSKQPSKRSPHSHQQGSEQLTPSSVAVYFSTQPQSSTSPYQQQQQLVFGMNPQIPGSKPFPEVTLDPSFRAAASNDAMISAFVQAMDKMAAGKV